MDFGNNVRKQIHHFESLKSVHERYDFLDDIITHYERVDKYNRCLFYWTHVRHELDKVCD